MFYFLLFVMSLGLCSCATSREWVNLDQCDQHVKVDGDMLGHCKKVKIEK